MFDFHLQQSKMQDFCASMVRIISLFFSLLLCASAAAQGYDKILKSYFVEKNIETPDHQVILRTFTAKQSSSRSGLVYVFVETNCGTCGTNVRQINKFGGSYEIYRDMAPAGAAVVANGGFYGYDHTGKQIALGLVVQDGQAQNPRIGWTSGGFLIRTKDGKTHIKTARSYSLQTNDNSVIQSKPLLVEAGKNGIRSDTGERFNRTAIALSSTGKLVVAGAFDGFGRAVSLHEFARFLLTIKSSDGSSINLAIAMDGGPGAQIYIPSLKQNFGDPGKNYVPNIISIEK
ncbi:phosphodiester glycosidase family protein [Dechloromonas denitrificans]|uniref:phosphodiester glycosidase family protein n=1 Tax=Dechloromonas denitrificans TaxID=281362 RepID=UPI001CF87791|nr:phosphodiester glycosidase family protein [Dechloromonas denitrificans]UCV05573.1 phosphodiester glycosidase family protein [Dechloromonas denitrificans]UCV09921.1 phosphodiester glycosidase family protein [Dechloromonas denitrificans]